MRIAALLFSVALTLTAGLPSAQAQVPTGTISGRILIDGVLARNDHGILVYAANRIEQPLSPYRTLQDAIFVRGEFTVTDLHDGEYLVILATTTDKLVTNLEETVEFANASPQVPGTSKRPAVRITIENGQADKEAVFELQSGFSTIGSGAPGDLPSTGVGSPTANSGPAYLAPAVAGLGMLLLAAGGLALRPRRREAGD